MTRSRCYRFVPTLLVTKRDMTTELKPIRTEADYKAALAEVERLWGAKSGTPDGDRLEVLATLIDAYEAGHYPMDPPERPRNPIAST